MSGPDGQHDDPGASPAPAGPEALALLRARAVPEEVIEAASRAGRLHLLVLEQFVGVDARYTQGDIEELTGLSVGQLRRFWRALGFPDVDPREAAFSDHDLDALAVVSGSISMGLTDEDLAVQLTRVIGSSMARITEAQVQSAGRHPPEESAAMAELLALTGGGSIGGIASILQHVWRRHLQVSVRRALLADDAGDGVTTTVAVGFADLVGFTALSQELSEHELAEVVGRFEELAYDTVAAAGGRVVKMIGDEVMFVMDDPVMAAHLGLALAEAYAGDETLSDVRVGLATGPVLQRDGDYYGPVINVASRIVSIAYPGAVVVSEAVRDAIAEVDEFELRSLRPRYLKDIGRVGLWAVTRPGTEPVGAPPRARRASPPGRAVVQVVLAELARRAERRRGGEGESEPTGDGGGSPAPTEG